MQNKPTNRCLSALAMSVGAGLAAPVIGGAPAWTAPQVHAQEFLGHYYIKPATGEVVFTPAAEYLANRAGLRTVGDDLTGDGVSDVWVAVNGDPCGLGTPTTPATSIGTLDTETDQGDYHLYRAHSASGDLRVESLTWSYWSDILDTDTDSNFISDGNTRGAGFELTFWDREDPPNVGSSAAPARRMKVVTYAFTNMPGPLTAPVPNYMSGFILTFDLTGFEFEMADTDGVGPATGFFNPLIGTDSDTDTDTFIDDDNNVNGTHDWSYSIRAIQPTNPAANEGLIGYQLAAPGIPGAHSAFDPNDGVIDLEDRFILQSSVVEPMGAGGLEELTELTLPETPTLFGALSLFDVSNGQSPEPTGPSGGFGSGDYFQFGSFDCPEDEGTYTHPYLALSGDRTGEPFCDCDDNGVLNIDDVDCFVAAFIAGNLLGADCDGSGALNVDDIDCFVSCFLAK
ncbi:MAG: hypothetical protein DHS20C14_18690 [Phycisphaeraceae bacterium]|nr:MAG: hypothetical protein DHS20C14_18690 [Phycisphaeraceae bacterium]